MAQFKGVRDLKCYILKPEHWHLQFLTTCSQIKAPKGLVAGEPKSLNRFSFGTKRKLSTNIFTVSMQSHLKRSQQNVKVDSNPVKLPQITTIEIGPKSQYPNPKHPSYNTYRNLPNKKQGLIADQCWQQDIQAYPLNLHFCSIKKIRVVH